LQVSFLVCCVSSIDVVDRRRPGVFWFCYGSPVMDY